ncbi:MAG: NAD(P)H-hydrate dehydratase, partial [Thermodesulfobacteriota bacterium]
AGLGALRSGSGLVTVAAPGGICGEIKQGWPDIMTLPLGSGAIWTGDLLEPLKEMVFESDAVVVGPGLGRDPDTVNFVHDFIKFQPRPTVYDADALFALAQYPELMPELPKESILTPHPGEMARLCGCSTADVQSNKPQTVRAIAKTTGCPVILKGPGTLIAAPESPLFLSACSCSNLAVGGSGDVLSGMLGGLLARDASLLDAACLAVFWHCLAGKQLQEQYPYRGNLAQEIAHALPRCLDL